MAFAFDKGITNGISAELFGSNNLVTCQQFTTFLIRALGYDDSADDFTYAGALAFALEIGLYTDDILYDLNLGSFLRGDAVVAMVKALHTNIKGSSDVTLLDTLVEAGVITKDQAEEFVEAIARIDEMGM